MNLLGTWATSLSLLVLLPDGASLDLCMVHGAVKFADILHS